MGKRSIEAIYPLSPMQQGMLFAYLYDTTSGVYCDQLNCILHGKLEVYAFKQAWQQVVHRHSILRTLFLWEDLREPLQVVYEQVELPWEECDWRHLDGGEQQRQLALFLQKDRARGFQLTRAPLLRITLLRESEATHRCVFSVHHLILDGWSKPLLLEELLALYNAYCQGQHLNLPPSRQYRDYILWLQRQDYQKAERFWRRLLKGFTAATPLKIDSSWRKKADGGADGFREQHVTLAREPTASLQVLARYHHLTMNTLMQGAWALLLNWYSGEKEVVYGTVVAGRPGELVGIERMIGLFINTLPVRVSISPDAALLSWLRALQAQQVEARQYEYAPLVEIQKWSDVPRGQPLFESIVVFENYLVDEHFSGRSERLEIEIEPYVSQRSYPLFVEGELGGGGLYLQVVYDHLRFDEAVVARVLDHLQIVLLGYLDTLLPVHAPQDEFRLGVLLAKLAEAEKQHQLLHEKELEEMALQQLRSQKRKATHIHKGENYAEL